MRKIPNPFHINTGIASGSDRFIHDSGKIVLAGENVQKITILYHTITRVEQGIVITKKEHPAF